MKFVLPLMLMLHVSHGQERTTSNSLANFGGRTDSPLAIPSQTSCPNVAPVVPPDQLCLESGCSVGSICSTQQVQGSICCKYVVNRILVSCCLGGTVATGTGSVVPANPNVQPPIQHPWDNITPSGVNHRDDVPVAKRAKKSAID